MATRDKLIFLSAIMRILRHFSVSFSSIWSFLRHGCHWCYYHSTEWCSTSPEADANRDGSSSNFFSSIHLCSLQSMDAQLQSMDACLDTLSDELCQLDTHVGRIAQWQARLGGFIESPSPSLKAFEDKDDDGDLMMMAMRMIMLARPVMMRCLFDILALCHSWQKKE